jgi:hypothetical protein
LPDWIEIVKKRLGRLGLGPAREAEIVGELAQHLEDACEEHLRQGRSEGEAIARALASIPDWTALRCGIRRAELGRSAAPAFVLLGVPILLLMVYYWAFSSWRELSLIWRAGDFAVRLSAPALTALVGIGILLAHLCRRVGGSLRDQVFAAIFAPASMGMVGLFLWVSSSMTLGHFGSLSAQFSSLVNLAAVPSLALLLGALTHIHLAHRQDARSANQGAVLRGASGLPGPFKILVPSMHSDRSGAAAFRLGIPWLALTLGVPLYLAACSSLEWSSMRLSFFHWRKGFFHLEISALQLGALVLLGFLLARASRRVGGGGWMQFAVALILPTWWLASLTFWELQNPLSFPPSIRLARFAGIALSSVVGPAFALALGALIALGARRLSLAGSPRGSRGGQ